MYPDPFPKTSGPAQGRGKVIVLPLNKIDEQQELRLSISKFLELEGFTQDSFTQWNFAAGADRIAKCVYACCSLDG